ncbi:MAG: hypothetical protein ABSH20_28455, partial [Tepidisphaeraceae bacterium]
TVTNLSGSENDSGVVTVTWQDTNISNAAALASFHDKITLTDTVPGSSYSSSTTVSDTGPISGGASSGLLTAMFQLPQGFVTTDALQASVQANSNQALVESNYANDTSTASAKLPEQYSATVTTTATTVLINTPVSITGHAGYGDTGDNATGVPLTVRVLLNGTPTILPVATDSNGNYSTTFTPTQTGVYGLCVAPPLSNVNVIQQSFDVAAISTGSLGPQTLVPGTPVDVSLEVYNLSPVSITGLGVNVTGAQSNLNVQTSIPITTITPYGKQQINIMLTAANSSSTFEALTFNVTTAIGAVASESMAVNITPVGPQLTATPPSLNTGMLVGEQTLVTFQLNNIGNQPTGDLNVTLPATSYLFLSSPAPTNPVIPSIPAGGSTTVTLQLLPPANMTLAEYTGKIEFSNSNVTFLEPFNFRAISTAIGDVQVGVTDYVTTGGLVGATARLLDPYNNATVIATGTTTTGGSVDLGNVDAGSYLLQVSAPNHTTEQQTITVVPGITNQESVYLPDQTVNYSWVITENPVTQHYSITLQATFATNVPAPVVTLDCTPIPTLAVNQAGQMTLTFTNHGLIAAQNVTFTVPSDPQYSFVPPYPSSGPNTYDIGAIPANSTVTVPLTVTNNGGTGAACHLLFSGTYQYIASDATQVTVTAGFLASVDVPGRVCTPAIIAQLPGFGGEAFSPGGGGGGGGGGSGGGINLGGAPILPSVVQPQSNVEAQVTIQIDQSAVLTGQEFTGTIQLQDELPQNLTNVGVDLAVTDSSGNPVSGDFVIEPPVLSGPITAVDGTGILAGDSTGTVTYEFIPTNSAAPAAPTTCNLGGTLTYTDPTTGQPVTITLYPTAITVQPQPQIVLNYFIEHNVYSTVPLGPSEPFYL